MGINRSFSTEHFHNLQCKILQLTVRKQIFYANDLQRKITRVVFTIRTSKCTLIFSCGSYQTTKGDNLRICKENINKRSIQKIKTFSVIHQQPHNRKVSTKWLFQFISNLPPNLNVLKWLELKCLDKNTVRQRKKTYIIVKDEKQLVFKKEKQSSQPKLINKDSKMKMFH